MMVVSVKQKAGGHTVSQLLLKPSAAWLESKARSCPTLVRATKATVVTTLPFPETHFTHPKPG